MAQQSEDRFGLKQQVNEMYARWDDWHWLQHKSSLTEILKNASADLDFLHNPKPNESRQLLKGARQFLEELDESNKHVEWLENYVDSVIEQATQSALLIEKLRDEVGPEKGAEAERAYIEQALQRQREDELNRIVVINQNVGNYCPVGMDEKLDLHELRDLYQAVKDVEITIGMVCNQAALVCRDFEHFGWNFIHSE